jgi:hypothetical protein
MKNFDVETKDENFRKMLGHLEDEYEIYAKAAKDLGWEVKTIDEWLNS